MAQSIDDGDPAFAGSSGADGMSLRDWFAGQVIVFTAEFCENTDRPWEVNAARTAYRLADALIAEKRRTEGGGT